MAPTRTGCTRLERLCLTLLPLFVCLTVAGCVQRFVTPPWVTHTHQERSIGAQKHLEMSVCDAGVCHTVQQCALSTDSICQPSDSAGTEWPPAGRATTAGQGDSSRHFRPLRSSTGRRYSLRGWPGGQRVYGSRLRSLQPGSDQTPAPSPSPGPSLAPTEGGNSSHAGMNESSAQRAQVDPNTPYYIAGGVTGGLLLLIGALWAFEARRKRVQHLTQGLSLSKAIQNAQAELTQEVSHDGDMVVRQRREETVRMVECLVQDLCAQACAVAAWDGGGDGGRQKDETSPGHSMSPTCLDTEVGQQAGVQEQDAEPYVFETASVEACSHAVACCSAWSEDTLAAHAALLLEDARTQAGIQPVPNSQPQVTVSVSNLQPRSWSVHRAVRAAILGATEKFGDVPVSVQQAAPTQVRDVTQAGRRGSGAGAMLEDNFAAVIKAPSLREELRELASSIVVSARSWSSAVAAGAGPASTAATPGKRMPSHDRASSPMPSPAEGSMRAAALRPHVSGRSTTSYTPRASGSASTPSPSTPHAMASPSAGSTSSAMHRSPRTPMAVSQGTGAAAQQSLAVRRSAGVLRGRGVRVGEDGSAVSSFIVAGSAGGMAVKVLGGVATGSPPVIAGGSTRGASRIRMNMVAPRSASASGTSKRSAAPGTEAPQGGHSRAPAAGFAAHSTDVHKSGIGSASGLSMEWQAGGGGVHGGVGPGGMRAVAVPPHHPGMQALPRAKVRKGAGVAHVQFEKSAR